MGENINVKCVRQVNFETKSEMLKFWFISIISLTI